MPIATQNDEDTRSLVRSFLDTFPYASLWTTELHEMLLIGSLQPLALNAEQIANRFYQSGVSIALRAVGISSPAALMATWITGKDGLERYAGKANPVTDNHPRIEYASWVRPKEIVHVLPQLLALRTDPPLMGADNAMRENIERERRNLLSFYDAGIAAYSGDRQRWREAIQNVFAADKNNPYYLWITGRTE